MYPTKYLTQTGAVQTVPGRLIGGFAKGGADAWTAIWYNHPDGATGDPIAVLGGAAGVCQQFNYGPGGIVAEAGIYVAITGTTPTIITVYA